MNNEIVSEVCRPLNDEARTAAVVMRGSLCWVNAESAAHQGEKGKYEIRFHGLNLAGHAPAATLYGRGLERMLSSAPSRRA